ncbi:MAG TPA: ABC transporter ATP-binding protein [Anaerolineales bacterium]|nr:ABC transporter ATP-binding protein [Anaerolineales bacterium]
MGFYEGLNEEKYDRQYPDRELTRRIVKYFTAARSQVAIIIVLTIVMAFITAAEPVVVSRGLDALRGNPTLLASFAIGGIVLFIGVSDWGLNWIRRSLTVRVVGNVILNLRTLAFRAAVEHDLSFYDQFSSGRIASRINSDTNDLGNLVVIITDVSAQILNAVLLGVVIVRTEWHLALILFAFLPFCFLLGLLFRSLARRVTRSGMQAMADVNAAIKETVSGIAIAKNFRQEASIFGTFNTANQTSYRVNVWRGFILSLVWPALNTLAGIATASLVYAGGLSAAQGAVTIGAWYLFIMSLGRFFDPVMNLSAFWSNIQSGLSAAERIFALMDANPNVVQTDSRDVPQLKGRIGFENVSFRYAENEPVLADFTLTIRPGENLAIVGHTGAGKSSLAKLIARFYEYQSGRLLIDGHDIRTFDLQQYRRQLGIVSQVPFLFSGTVADNIRYACAERDCVADGDILSMARRIGDGEWLETLPDGLNTLVGERGAMLSMGQRQLVALMRVLMQKPAIFVLDEATASIDPFTEWQIQQALNMILAESTSILIAHRLSTVKAADRIIVLEKGKIIEEGNHQGLLDRGGHYATLYNTYFRHQSLAYVEQMKEMVSK